MQKTNEQLMNEAIAELDRISSPVPRTTRRIAALTFPFPIVYECLTGPLSIDTMVTGIQESLALMLFVVTAYGLFVLPRGLKAYLQAEKYRKAFFRDDIKELTGKDIEDRGES